MTPSPIRILFVDDSEAVLSVLRRMVQYAEYDWISHFAIGGPEAIAALEMDQYDVIVTDIEMPEINGIKLLKYVQKKFPELIRVIYSGSLTKENVREVASFTHRFISKPCEMDKLINTIENTLFIYRELDNSKIRKVLTKTGAIPSLPKIYNELMAKIDSEDFSLREAAHLISSDVGMSANILKQINLLGYAESIHSIEQAVTMLGLNSIKAIALSTHIFHSMNSEEVLHFSLQQLVRHSMLTAHFAKIITKIETDNHDMCESAFVAGVLHDMGSIIFASNFPAKYGDALERVYNTNRPIAEVERNLIGISHGDIGAHLLALWGFSRDILHAVAFHEQPENSLDVSFSTLTAVYVGSYLAHSFEEDRAYHESDLIDSPYLKSLNCSSRYQLWCEKCRELYESLEE